MSAVAAIRRSYKELVDGTLRVQIDIEPNDKANFLSLFPEPGTPMGIAALCTPPHAPQVAPVADRAPESKLYGDYAKALRQSGFCRAPDVWRAAGSDAEFREWLTRRSCAASTTQCHGDIVAAHVRRVANGAGAGIKPEYSAIPLCHFHHAQQHQHGESVIFPKEDWDRLRIEYLEDWCWESIKNALGHQTMAAVAPQELLAWAQAHEIERYLPACYREAA